MLTSKEVAAAATRALDSTKGVGIQLIRVGDVTTLADYFLICTGTSNTHVKTLCDCAEATLEGLGETMLGREGTGATPGSCWILAAWSFTCSPMKPGSFTTWSVFGATGRSSP